MITGNLKSKQLEKPLQQMHKAADGLHWSLQRCQPLDISQLSAEDEEKFETLTARFARFARFARMSDIIIQKTFRLVDELDLESPGTVTDKGNHATTRFPPPYHSPFTTCCTLSLASPNSIRELSLKNSGFSTPA